MYKLLYGFGYYFYNWKKETKKREKDVEHIKVAKKWLNDTRVDNTGIEKRFNYWYPDYHISKLQNDIQKGGV